MSFTVNKLDVAFFQRDITNSKYEQINISGSSAIFYLDVNGYLTATSLSDLLKSSGTTQASLLFSERNSIIGEPLYGVDTVSVGSPNRLSKYYADPNNPFSYRIVQTQTPTVDTLSGIGIGKTDSPNSTLDILGNVIITGSLTVTGLLNGNGELLSDLYVPYISASKNTDLGNFGISGSNIMVVGDIAPPTPLNGKLWYDTSDTSSANIITSGSLYSLSSSYSTTASYALNGGGSSLTTGSTYPITASWSVSSSWTNTSSYAVLSTTSSNPIIQFIKVDASEFIPITTFGAGILSNETVTNLIDRDFLTFDPAQYETAQYWFNWPYGWNTVKISFFWTATPVSGSIVIWSGLRCCGNGEAQDSPVSSYNGIISAYTGANISIRTSPSNPITPAGTIAPGNRTILEIWRDPGHVSDTLATDMLVEGVLIERAS